MIMFRGCKIAFYKLNFQRAHFTNYHHMSESILNLVNLFLGKGRSCRPEMFCQKSVFEILQNAQKTRMSESPFLKSATLLYKRLWHRCLPLNFAKILRTPFSVEDLRWLLL